ncbi:MAG: hypothetical protein JSW55_15065 [Chloroflexota bacterium]|nr:MAG: hypothetical protein JSW55_15065 [Chloroflexota bacterium]
MSSIALPVEGVLYARGERMAFMLRPGDKRHVIRLGFILRGAEEVLFPESLLDDWGHEISTVELYDWARENGPHFPRAEIFGFDLTGAPGQCFVREVDLMAGYACYHFEMPSAAMTSGARLDAILLPEPGSGRPRRLRTPAGVETPLADASVEWWVVDFGGAGQPDLAFLDQLDSQQPAQ